MPSPPDAPDQVIVREVVVEFTQETPPYTLIVVGGVGVAALVWRAITEEYPLSRNPLLVPTVMIL